MEQFELTKNQLRLIALLATRPEPDVSVRETARYLSWPPSSTSRVINQLEKTDLVTASRRGRLKLVRLNPDHPDHQETVKLARKYYGLIPLLRSIVSQVDHVSLAIVFGSAAAGLLDDRGIIDLLVVGKPNQAKLTHRLKKSQRMFDREVNCTFLTLKEFIYQKQKSSFLKSVLKGPIVVLLS